MNAIIEISKDCKTHWTPDISLCEAWINCALETEKKLTPYNISINFVEASVSAALNEQYRGKQSATNVLSFPAEFPAAFIEQLEYVPLGDIVVCPEIVEQEAAQQNKEAQAHWAHLLIHGLLHLLGHDHQTEKCSDIMETLEIKALERLGFPNPYLIG